MALAAALDFCYCSLDRITAYRDYLVVDTACLIGFPLGYRSVELSDDGFFKTRFHTLDLPDLMQASYDRSTPEENWVWGPHLRPGRGYPVASAQGVVGLNGAT